MRVNENAAAPLVQRSGGREGGKGKARKRLAGGGLQQACSGRRLAGSATAPAHGPPERSSLLSLDSPPDAPAHPAPGAAR